MINTQNNTLLQTATALIGDFDDSSNYVNVRMLFDNCSQKTFIKAELAERLNLKVLRTEILTVKKFGNSSEKIEK